MGGRLEGKVAIISGGASGIGAGHVRVFAAEGAQVVCADLNEKLGREVVESVNSNGGKAIFLPLDVSDSSSWKQVVDQTVKQFGKLTTLVNNAGIFHPGGVVAETEEGWQKMIAVNQTGVLLGMKAAVGEIKKAGGGAIVNISSLFGLIGSPNAIAYHATKGAVRLMTKGAALEFVNDGIRVNSIHPGQIDTPILADITPEQDKAIKAAIPMGKLGRPEDIAYASLFLCSEESAYITGVELPVDGGWYAS